MNPSPLELSRLPTFTVTGATVTSRARLSDDELYRLVQWCLDHRRDYELLQKAVFWDKCSQWIGATFRKQLHTPRRVVDRLMKVRKDEIRVGGGKEVSDTLLKRALDQWIEFHDHIKELLHPRAVVAAEGQPARLPPREERVDPRVRRRERTLSLSPATPRRRRGGTSPRIRRSRNADDEASWRRRQEELLVQLHRSVEDIKLLLIELTKKDTRREGADAQRSVLNSGLASST
ncbi:hypothetical protein CDV55_107279 [Aspergillus terreus]|uniref:Uncharacterized protein n=1 Tax=Aspergillus terreus TaxID=33178 RepID=A0A5M3ZGX9_ASPTE|nr:hypothetical protein ATETN484_0016010600 [Aspergillus terreus]GFF21535.1 hypothetical protein CDV55_107279 [Aspergillus terreus]